MAKRPSMPRPCTLAGTGWRAAGVSADQCVQTRIVFGMCCGESCGVQSGTVARESL